MADRSQADAVNERVIDGVIHVWSIFDNTWVTLEYWRYVNGRTPA